MFYLIHTIKHNGTDLHNYGLLKLDIDDKREFSVSESFVQACNDLNNVQFFFIDIEKKILMNDSYFNNSDYHREFLGLHFSDKIKAVKEYVNDDGDKITIEFTKLGKTKPVIINFKSKIIKQSLYQKIMDSEIDIATIEYISNVVKYKDDSAIITTNEEVVVKSRDGLHFSFTDDKVEYLPMKDGELLKIKLSQDGSHTLTTRGWDLCFDSFINAQQFAKSVELSNQAIFSGAWYKNIKSGLTYEVNMTPYRDINGDELLLVKHHNNVDNLLVVDNLIVKVNEFHKYFTMA